MGKFSSTGLSEKIELATLMESVSEGFSTESALIQFFNIIHLKGRGIGSRFQAPLYFFFLIIPDMWQDAQSKYCLIFSVFVSF